MATLQAVLSNPLIFAPGAVSGYPVFIKLESIRRFRLATGVSSTGTLYTGSYYVAGTVTINAVPVSRKVRLYLLKTGQLAGETWSAADGSYRFDGLEMSEYYVWSEDYLRQYDPVSHLVPLLGG